MIANPTSTAAGHRRHYASRALLAVQFCCTAVLLAGAFPLALLLADPLLTVRDSIQKADVIVVLGGDGPSRASRAADLWLSGIAPRILVSGDGDCYWIREAMVDRGVDRRAIDVECQSGTTWENALFSAPILRQMNVRSAVLVTSWFHSRRALASFIATSGNIRWISIPTEPRKPLPGLSFGPDGIQILKEYPKTIWYAIRRFSGIDLNTIPTPFPSREVRA